MVGQHQAFVWSIKTSIVDDQDPCWRRRIKIGELAEALNDCFTNVTSDIQPLDFSPVDTKHSPDEYVISPESVEKALLSIKERKSNGTDDIPNWVLKNFASALYVHSSIHQLMKAMNHPYGSALMLYR